MKPRDLAELIRLPAALTVPGDSLAGAAAADWPLGRRTWALPLASACLYWAGMALNDYADRDLDRHERPERPIPSGRVRPDEALAIATGLTGAGLAIAGAAGGKRALRVAAPLAATVWAYDLLAKPTAAGPPCMAAARGLDVLLGAGERWRDAAGPAAAVATHTVAVTGLSRGEVHGSSPAVGKLAVAGTAAAATAAAASRSGRKPLSRVAAGILSATYATVVGRHQLDASRTPDAPTVRRATGTGVRGVILLQSALAARSGALGTAAAILAAGPAARIAAKVVSPT
ncbi:4-hydroxybenzoate polyprenyltransferase [Actinobacteria bacterium YIM 96077]|uniref:4-hydroxybenzoate polyprenyltransferase n=1 Tax=Phytoactinopolyspora halophila TaxID=1981511 RepID=A0A329QKX8_9ACTN|nr:UbiA family prenyltransferase [Phytoactinopolyspora halophila]AYY14771.1 4-hydroxybenzoate polyprenyltransferase [Actinobacteria bacterium YIM 96077]RAW13045.1 4-hydroxybenzoate polyprenyltransferase [Phytoactinopolyspora halophila]